MTMAPQIGACETCSASACAHLLISSPGEPKDRTTAWVRARRAKDSATGAARTSLADADFGGGWRPLPAADGDGKPALRLPRGSKAPPGEPSCRGRFQGMLSRCTVAAASSNRRPAMGLS